MADSEQIKRQATEAAKQAKEKAGQLAHDNQDKVSSTIDKLAGLFNDKTSGKYADKVEKAQEAAHKNVDKLAQQRPEKE
ncbi:antitoxin [Rudaeicoccus suwonensis]|uniref:Antitoxin protein of toxin-antitoxin system n=1 Tax=Rudaeicoccus suwonensis TaxID=657409 RepID=A0A561E755_9MICO|nr:antitoxin [Rudaeicoccus suwonensis]TWE11432.1 antitoxin protein of toxin-antitoxin system [Rudaeicoccus suwonensis]